MKQAPYQPNPGNACALACYTMIAQYLLPKEHITFEQLGVIGNWRKGYVINEVVFHDPNFSGSGEHRRESLAHFIRAFEKLESRALARYSLEV